MRSQEAYFTVTGPKNKAKGLLLPWGEVDNFVYVYRESWHEPVEIGFFCSSRRRHTRWTGDWSSDVCSSDLSSLVLPFHRPCQDGGRPPETVGGRAEDEGRVEPAAVGHGRARLRRGRRGRPRLLPAAQIGRASCRERGERPGGAGSFKKKNEG